MTRPKLEPCELFDFTEQLKSYYSKEVILGRSDYEAIKNDWEFIANDFYKILLRPTSGTGGER